MNRPKIVDNDAKTITIFVGNESKQSWVYSSREDRAEKIRRAWYWCDGFCAGQGALRKLIVETASVTLDTPLTQEDAE